MKVGLRWVPTTSLNDWSPERLENVRKLIIKTTGEAYRIERLRLLPLDENFGRWALTDGGSEKGILWAMRLSENCARVLAFSVCEDLQGRGFGAEGWRLFALAAKSFGIQTVQLEVRQDNHTAIHLYHNRGLRPRGTLTGFYRGHDGWLMLGPLHLDSALQ